jgi:hypothetical protein
MKTTLFLLLCVVSGLATEVRLQNHTGGDVRFESEGVRLVLRPGVSSFEWPDSAAASVGTSDSDMQAIALTDNGVTEILLGLDAATFDVVVTVEGRAGWLEWWTAGFLLGFTFFGFGLTLRIVKKTVNHSPEI